MDIINGDITEQMSVLQENMPFFIEMGMRLTSAALILIAGWVIGNWLSKRIHNIKKLDETLSSFLGGFVKYIVFAVSVVTVLGQFGVQTASLLAVLGAAGLAIGLALQGTLSNVAAGTMILILRPFKVGDFITSGGISGTVKTLGLFGTEMATPDNVYIFVPNSKVWNAEIMNYTRNTTRRQDIVVGISYDDNINDALKVISDLLDKEDRVMKSPDDKKPQVVTSNMGDFSIDLIVRFWCESSDYWALKWDLTKTIKETLDQNGISIPFPTRTIEMVNTTENSSKKAA